MPRTCSMFTVCLLVGTALAWAGPAPVAVSPADSQAWQDYLVPLPKQVQIDNKIVVPASQVAILSRTGGQAASGTSPVAPGGQAASGTSVAPDGSDILIAQAVKELRDSLGQRGAAVAAGGAAFSIKLELLSADAELSRLKNAPQAYRIRLAEGRLTEGRPGAGEPASLAIQAIDTRGLYYGAKTLQQLIRARLRDGQAEIPLAKIIDWPDMEDRGLWGAENYDHIAWMSDRKMNIVEQISDFGIDDNGKTFGRLKAGREAMVTQGPQHAVQPVPAILHLEQISGKGVFKNHPELKGLGTEHEGAICYSKPIFVDILADWIVELCQLPGVNDVDVWMAENMQGKKGCQCEQCKGHDRSVMEAEVIGAAYAKAKTRVKDLTLRILTSEETENSNRDILKVLPPEIRVWYYHSLTTYTAGEEPMVRDYLAEAAKKGRWVGMCPNVVNVVHFAEPNTTPQFIHYRMNEFVDKGMSGLIGYATPRVYYGFFLVEGAAEWTWNAKGRTPHEFARTWAIRQGMKDPALFAEYADTIGPVAWDVYGSDWPHGEQREMVRVAKKLKEGTLPKLGESLWGVYRSPWGDIKNVEQLNRDVEQAGKAVILAKRLGDDEFVYESLIVQGYIRSLKSLWELKQIVTKDGIAPNRKALARKWFKAYTDSLNRSAELLPKWEATLPMRKPDDNFTERPLKTIRQIVDEMTQVAKDLGVE